MMRRTLQDWMYQNNCAEYNPDHVTKLYITDLVKRHVGILNTMEQTIFSVLSNQEPVTMVTNAQQNFHRGLLSTKKKGK
jgi:hypothetical protein